MPVVVFFLIIINIFYFVNVNIENIHRKIYNKNQSLGCVYGLRFYLVFLDWFFPIGEYTEIY